MPWPLSRFIAAQLHARRNLPLSERRMHDKHNLNFWTNLGLLIALAIGFATIYAHGGNRTVAIAAFGAALAVGGVLGFLFGVPSPSKAAVQTVNAGSVAINAGSGSKAVGGNVTMPDAADAAPEATTPEPPAAPQPSTPNISNLEQVADWVTKLLLGGGLTQMQRIPPTVWRWARLVALGIEPCDSGTCMAQQQAFAGGLLVYAFILGFFGGFLITKLQLGTAISD